MDDQARLKARVAELEARPAIDMDQFLPAVEALRREGQAKESQGYDRLGPEGLDAARAKVAEASRLLALIDGSKGGCCGTCGDTIKPDPLTGTVCPCASKAGEVQP